MSERMPDIEPLVCIDCVRQVDPLSDDAEGWVTVQRSVDGGDLSDDPGWKCPDCATASDEYFGDPGRQVRDALADKLPDKEDPPEAA